MEHSESIAQRVDAAIRAVVAHAGFDLVIVEYVARSHVLRLYIDREAGVTLDDCSQISRRVSDLLDAEGITEGEGGIAGRYTLEVSSPGLDRPLVRPEHFIRFVGHKVRLATHTPFGAGGQRNVTGTLVTADAQGVSIEADGEQRAIAYATIDRARLVPEL